MTDTVCSRCGERGHDLPLKEGRVLTPDGAFDEGRRQGIGEAQAFLCGQANALQFGEWRSVLERAATGLGKLLHAHPDWCLCGACKPVSTPAPCPGEGCWRGETSAVGT